jgi:hypothetical protein
MNDDFLLDDEDEELNEDDYYIGEEDTDDEEDEDQEEVDDEESDKSGPIKSTKLTADEIWLRNAYDDIVAAGAKLKDDSIQVAAQTIVLANPKHTSTSTVNNIIRDMFQSQGHHRMVNSVYNPETALRGEDIDIDFLGTDDDAGFNKKFSEDAKNQIARFIDYLANRDLSKDSVIMRNKKRRHLPAFLIFLFSSGMYDLVINCPTMPKEYQDQIKRALDKITNSKYDIVEELALAYEKAGRPKVAERVRQMQLAWFTKEPAEIKTALPYRDLELTYDDILIYREYRSKYTNISKSITQDVISDLIEVVVDPEAGIYQKLKDKTRSEAINEVKQIYKTWAKENPVDSDLANKVIWKDTDSITTN